MYLSILFFLIVAMGIFGGLINYLFAMIHSTVPGDPSAPDAATPVSATNRVSIPPTTLLGILGILLILVISIILSGKGAAFVFWTTAEGCWLMGAVLLALVLIPALGHLLKGSSTQITPAADITRSVVSGIGAAALVPLFLNLTSSNLVDHIKGNSVAKIPPDSFFYFVFAGLCLLAAISSTAFIRSLSDKVLAQVARAENLSTQAASQARKAESKADKAGAKVDAVAAGVKPLQEAASEQAGSPPPGRVVPEVAIDGDDGNAPATPEEMRNAAIQKGIAHGLSPEQATVLAAFLGGEKPYRSIDGLAVDTGLDPNVLTSVINALANKTFLGQIDLSDGPRWYITDAGRSVFT
ncbi:MAG: hypothetical protein JWL77_3314 [Chthonomonadaceae bacterium]|nr:hypothetical protein [Chthonomonadaceae bacterium]